MNHNQDCRKHCHDDAELFCYKCFEDLRCDRCESTVQTRRWRQLVPPKEDRRNTTQATYAPPPPWGGRFYGRNILTHPFCVLLNNKKVLEELMIYFPLIRYGPHRKQRLYKIFVITGTSLSSRCLYPIPGTQTHAFSNSSIFACIRCRGKAFTEPFPINGREEHIQTQTDWWDLLSTPLRWAQVPYQDF
jgi:hypothetical protein